MLEQAVRRKLFLLFSTFFCIISGESSYHNSQYHSAPSIARTPPPTQQEQTQRASSDYIFVRDAVHNRLYGPYMREGRTLEAARSSGAELVVLNPVAVPVGEAARRGGRWYVRGPDGVLRGAYPAEAMRLWLDAAQLPPHALAYAGISLTNGSGNVKDDPWKSTWLKHLRPHRWRATRKAVKIGKVAAKSSASAVASVAVRSWAEEEAEWADLVTKAHVSRLPPPPPPSKKSSNSPDSTAIPGEERRPPFQQQRQHSFSSGYKPQARPQVPPRALDVSKQRIVTDAWRDDTLSQRYKRRFFLLTFTALFGLCCYALFASGLLSDLIDQAESWLDSFTEYSRIIILPKLQEFLLRFESVLIILVRRWRGLGAEFSDSEEDYDIAQNMFSSRRGDDAESEDLIMGGISILDSFASNVAAICVPKDV